MFRSVDRAARGAAPVRIGLALGSGGARGWAHVGALERLAEMGVPVHVVAGASAGSIAGAAFAANRLAVLRDLARHMDWHRAAALFLEVGLPRSGLLTGRKVIRLLRDVLGAGTIEELRLPFAAVATDLHDQGEVVFDGGDLLSALRASIAIPGIFTPVHREGRMLVDGGLVNPLPVSVARRLGATYVIAIDVNLRPGRGCEPPRAAGTSAPEGVRRILDSLRRRLSGPERGAAAPDRRGSMTVFDVLAQTIRIVENQIARTRLVAEPPDLLIQPAVGDLMTLEFHRAEGAMAAGAAAVDAAADSLAALRTRVAAGTGE
jgi:NTE family protein